MVYGRYNELVNGPPSYRLVDSTINYRYITYKP